MKRIITILILFVCGTASAQVYQRMPQYGYEMQRAKMDSVLQVPGDTIRNKTGVARIGTKLYAGNGTYWTEAGGTTIDTTGIRLQATAGPGISISGTYPNLTFSGNPDTLTAADPLQLSTVSTKKVRMDFRRAWLDSLLALQVDSSGLLDSALLRGDSLFTYTGGVESYRGKVSGGGGVNTLQEAFDASGNPQIDAGGNSLVFQNAGFGAFYSTISGSGFSGFEVEFPSASIKSITPTGESSFSASSKNASIIVQDDEGGATSVRITPRIFKIDYSGLSIGDTSGNVKLGIGLGAYGVPTAPLHVVGDGTLAAKIMNGSVGIGTETPAATLHISSPDSNALRIEAPLSNTQLATDSQLIRGANGQVKVRPISSGGSGVTTAQLTDSLNSREPRYKFRNDSTGNAGYTTLYQNGLKANTASPTFTGTVTLPTTQATGRTALQGVTINKDSLPITTTNRWAVTIDTPTSRLQRYDLNTKANTADPTFTGSITLSSTTGGIGLPAMTQAQMNAITPPVGAQIYNTTYGAVCTYTSDWGWWSNDPAWLTYNGWQSSNDFIATGNGATTTALGDFYAQIANSGTITSSAGTANRPGIIQLSTSTSATAQARLLGDVISGQTLLVGGGRLLFDAILQVPTLSNSTETFYAFAGYSSSGSAVNARSIAFLYDSSGSNTGSAAIGRWQVVTSNGSSRTYTPTDSTVTAGKWYRLQAVINAAGTSVQFYINGGLVRTESSTIPSGTMTPIACIVKTAGTTARSLLVDIIHQRQKFTTPR